MADDVRAAVGRRLAAARGLVPATLLPRLPASPRLLGESEWHPFEGPIWALGEEIRQLLLGQPRLRREGGLQLEILAIACDRRAHRGRQSFVMLLGIRAAVEHGPALVTQLDDPGVAGHVISSLYKMRARGFVSQVWPFLEDDKAWVRREARRYVAWEAGGQEWMPRPKPHAVIEHVH